MRIPRIRAVDRAIILFCLAGAAASGTAFWLEYNHTLTKLNEEEVGTIIFKKRTAQRKFVDRVVWDTLKQTSPVYNGDTIRTIVQSEAVVIFQDEATHLRLDESTLIQIFFDGKRGAKIDFSDGNLEVASGSKAIEISHGDSNIVVDGQASLNKSEEGFGLSVLEGRVNLDGNRMESGSIFAVDSSGNINTKPLLAMTSFGASARVLGSPGEAVSVSFSWNTSNFNPDTHVIVEVFADRSLNRIVHARDVTDGASTEIPLESGQYYWRVYPANGGSAEPANWMYPKGSLEVVPAVTAVLLAPAREAEIVYIGESRVAFSWSGVESASAYLVEVSAQSDMSAPAVSRRVTEKSLTQTGLESGLWYWRITPLFPPWINGSVPPSAVSEFTVARGNPVLAAPVLTFPPDNGITYMDGDQKPADNRLLWLYDSNAASWLVELADNPAMINPSVKQNAAVNYFSLPARVLQAGKTWYWRVSAMGGANPAVSGVRAFEVGSENLPPEKPAPAPVPVTAAEPVREPPQSMQWREQKLIVTPYRSPTADSTSSWTAIVREYVLANADPERWPQGVKPTEKTALEALKQWNPGYFIEGGEYMARGLSIENTEAGVGGRTGIAIPWLREGDEMIIRIPFQPEYPENEREGR